MSKINWNEENTAKLTELAGDVNTEVSQERLVEIADEMGTTPRSVGSKLRKMEFSVAKAGSKASAWTEVQEAAITELVNANPGKFTYAELSEQFEGGAFTPKQLQGKLLNMQLYGQVRKADKKEATRLYTEVEEAKFVEMAKDGASVEKLADAFGKSTASIRGKALSLLKVGSIDQMPKQEVSLAKEKADPLDGLDVSGMTVAEIAEETGKTERGIKSILSHRGITCTDHDGAAKRKKLDSKAD